MDTCSNRENSGKKNWEKDKKIKSEKEQVLKTTEEYNRLINTMNTLGICISRHLWDENFTLLWASDSFYRDAGYEKEEYESLFSGMAEYYVNYPEDLQKIRDALLLSVSRRNRHYATVCRMPVKGGGFHWIRIAGSVIEESAEGPPILYSVYTDVEDMIRKEQEQQKHREKLQKALDMANMAKSDFLTRMSHDIRTPMNAILGMTQLAQECPGNPQRTVDCLRKIRLSAEALLSLINDVLDMSKIESGRLSVNRKPFSLLRLLRRLNAIFDTQAAAKGSSLRVEYPERPRTGSAQSNSGEDSSDEYSSGEDSSYKDSSGEDSSGEGSSDDWDCYIGDELKLERILMNLLGNAVKYTNKGDSILLCVTLEAAKKGWVEACFCVKDTGIGIDRGLLSRIFEPFERGVPSEEIYSGSGLGLSIAENYARLMNGTIGVESCPGKGSCFTLRLPLEKAEPALQKGSLAENTPFQATVFKNAPAQSSPLTMPAKSFEGKRILLVEDNVINQEIAQCLLEARGFHIDTADNGAKGTARFADSPEGYYFAVIMDIQMPVMDGLEATRHIRALPRKDAASVPIIAMSANAFSEDVEKSLAAGMNAHISKPFQIDELMSLLKEF